MYRRIQAVALAAAALLAGAGSVSAGAYEEQVYEEHTYQRSGGGIRDGYPIPQPPPAYDAPRYQSYKDDPPPPRPLPHRTCLSKPGLRDALNAQGWHAFDEVEYRGDLAYLTAVNPAGRRFALQVDICHGNVVDASPVVVYSDRPAYYYEPRPAVGIYFGGGGYHRHHHRW